MKTLQVRFLLLSLAVVTSGRAQAADPAGRVPQAEPLRRADGPGVARSWLKPDRSEVLVHGELIGWAGDRVEIKDRSTGAVRTFAIAEISAGDRQWIKHWSEPTKRPALRKFGAHVRCQDDGSIILVFGQTDTTDADFAHVKALPEVTEIGLIDCRVTDVGLEALKDLPRLRRLAIANTGVYGPGFAHLAALKSLETFLYAANDEDTKIAPHLQHLTTLKLKNLTLRGCAVGAEGLPHIGKLTDLETLELVNCSVKSGPAPLAGLTKLRKLDLSHNRIPVADFGALTAFTGLRDLDISGGGMTPAGAAHIVKLTNLERLVMPRSTDNDTVAVLAALTKLKSLHLTGERITDAGVAHLKPMVNLEHLTLPFHTTGAALPHLEGMTRLKTLRFEGAKVSFTQALKMMVDVQKRSVVEAVRAIDPLSESVDKVTELSLDVESAFDKDALPYLARLPDLERLTLSNGFREESLQGVAAIKTLRRLAFRGGLGDESMKLSAAGFKHLAGCPLLETLEFSLCEFGAGALAELKPLPKLTLVRISDCKLAEGNFAGIGRLTTLESLGFDEVALTDDDMTHFAGLENLKFLKLPDGITLKGLAHTGRLKKLETLAADYDGMFFADVFRVLGKDAGRPTGRVLELISALHRSRETNALILSFPDNPKMTAADLRCLVDVPDVQHLTFAPGVNDEGLAHVTALKKLESLSLPQSAVTDAGLLHLTGLSGLKHLKLDAPEVTDAGLKHLAGLKGLIELDLAGTKVTDAGIAELLKQLPSTTIRK